MGQNIEIWALLQPMEEDAFGEVGKISLGWTIRGG